MKHLFKNFSFKLVIRFKINMQSTLKKTTLPSERSTPSPLNLQYEKVFKRSLKTFYKMKAHLALVSVEDVLEYGHHERCESYDLTCTCRLCMDNHRKFITYNSLSASMSHWTHEEQLEILNYDYCMCESEACDCFFPIERVQLHAFLYTKYDSVWPHNFERLQEYTVLYNLYKTLCACDKLDVYGTELLYKALKNLVFKLDFTRKCSLRSFLRMLKYEYLAITDKANLSEIPELLMMLRPDLLKSTLFNEDKVDLVAQIGDTFVTRQCISDKIDTLIMRLDRLDAQSLFTIKHEHKLDDSIATSLMNILSDLKESVKDILLSTFKFSLIAIAAILYVVLAYAIITRLLVIKPRYMVAVHIILALSIMYIDDQGGPGSLVAWCKSKLQVSQTALVSEDGNINSNILSFLPLFLINSMSIPADIASKIITSKFLDSLGRKISFLGDARFFTGMSTIADWVKSGYETIRKHFCSWIGVEYIPDIAHETDAVADWSVKCDKLIYEYNQKELLYSESTRSYLSGLYQEGCRFARHPIYKNLSTSILQSCRNLLIIIDKINQKLNVSGSLRNPPVTLMLYGETGAGKSSLTLPLSIAILREIYKREKNIALLEQLKSSWQTLIYPRNSEQEFWDGYTGQKVCIFDDWNQLVDSASNPSMELFELIRASNVFPYPLHMAHLEDKSSVNFSSDVIICSSNNKMPKVESLNFPQALIRRFTKFVRVHRVGDSDKFSFDNYVITPYDERGEGGSISVETFVQSVVNDYMKSKSFVSSINEFVTDDLLSFDPTELVELTDIRSDPKFKSEVNDDIVNRIKFDKLRALKSDIHSFVTRTAPPRIDENVRSVAEELPPIPTWNERLHNEDSLFIADATGNIRSQLEQFTIKEKLSAFCQKYSFLNFNTTYILGAIGLIAGGLVLYKALYPSNDSSNKAESLDKLDKYVRERINTRKSDEAYESVLKAAKVVNSTSEAYESQPKPKLVEAYESQPKPKLVEAYESIPKPKRVTEACVDLVATEMGSALAMGNLYRVYCECEEKEVSIGHCLFLIGDVAIMPKHFVMSMELLDNPTIYFASPIIKRVFPVKFKDLVFNEYTDKFGKFKDIVSFRVPGARIHADIRNKFAPSSTLSAVGTTRICLVTINCVSPNKPLVLDRKHGRGVSCLRRVATDEYSLACANTVLKVHDAWEYSTLETQKGDCGAPLLATNERIAPGKIIGIHVAGGLGTGVSTAIFKEDIDIICDGYPKLAQLNSLEVLPAQNPYPDCELLFYGKLSKAVIQPSVSKIIPSLVHNEITEPKTSKTWLRPGYLEGEIFDPLEYRTRRMGKPSVPIPLDIVNIARGAVLREFKRVYLKFSDTLENRFKCPYSFEETCIGTPGEEFVNAVKRDTSCGFPFVQEGITRKMIFGSDDDYDVNTKGARLLEELVNLYDNSALEGFIYDHYFTDTLKDERKPKHKAHKTRMFAACPIDYLLWCKKWFNGVVAIISELRNRIHISVGTNVYSTDWHHMAEQMLRKSKRFVAGDFEGFDASQQSYLLQSACWILIEFNEFIFGEDPEAKTIMWSIVYGLFNSFHISGDNVFQWVKSLPSGHYLTAIINSIFVLLALVVTFLMAMEEQGTPMSDQVADDFFKFNDVVTYGDDHCIAISDKYTAFYNQNTLVGLLRRLGLYYTDELKTGSEVPDYRSIEEISFLKRKFFYNSEIGRWVAPLDLDVILETPMWVRKCPDMELQTFNNIEFSLRELSLHSEEVWNEWAPRLLALCETHCRLVSNFCDKRKTMVFTLNTILAQSEDVIFDRNAQMQGFNSDYMLSLRKVVDIYPYLTGLTQAAPKHPVSPARLRREGALEAESNSPAENKEIKDNQYQEQPSTDDVQQITTFENDMSVATQDVPMPTPLDIGLRSMHTDDAHHTIVSFLKRPMILREFTWSSSQPRGADVFPSIAVPNDMLIKQFLQKLQGFMSFRATAVINVQFQTQPFQAGRFIMAAVPLPSLLGSRKDFITNRISNLTLLNHVQADIAKQTEVTIRVPYISPLIAFDLLRGNFSWAQVVGKVYSPVSSVGSTNVDGIVYVHFEDVQLGAPTSMPVFSAQSLDLMDALGEAPTTSKPKYTSKDKFIPFEPDVLTDVRMRAKELGLTSTFQSKATGALQKINRKLGEYVPFTKPVTDALDKYVLQPIDDFIGPILNIFGFSKPITEGDDKLLRPATNFSTFDGKDRALTLATSDDTNAPFLPSLNGTGLDEMSFDYLKKIPQYIGSFKYSVNDNRNNILYNFAVRPSFNAPENVKVLERNIPQPSHLSYITQPFLYWTGSIVTTFKFVKTDYHSGRVEISFHPNVNPMETPTTLKKNVDFDMAYRYIVDLRDKSEVSLRIPYMGTTPFKRNTSSLYSPNSVGSKYSDSVSPSCNVGRLVVRALTPLKASNAVVSGTIEVLVEYNAGNDFQVMCPVKSTFAPITPLEPSLTRSLEQYHEETAEDAQPEPEEDQSGGQSTLFEAQSSEASVAGLALTRQTAIEGSDPPTITSNTGEVRNPSASYAVSGEIFKNFRDLCHRTNFYSKIRHAQSYKTLVHNFYIPPLASATGSGETFKFSLLDNSCSPLGYVGGMYALARGSVNVRVQPSNYKGFISARLDVGNGTINDCLYPRAIEDTNIKGVAEFHVPFYCRSYQFDHLKYNSSVLNDVKLKIGFPYGSTVDAVCAVSGGDDINFGYFVGTPFVVQPSDFNSYRGVDPYEIYDPDVSSTGKFTWNEVEVQSS